MKGGIFLVREYSIDIGGRTLTIEIGKAAKQANGAAVMRYGDTVVLVTATASKDPREGIDFFPLTVDFEERQYAVGKIPGGFIKREGRPTELATLTARIIDRPIRPLFPKGFKNDVHIVATVMSVEKDNAPDVTAVIGASVALGISNIPFNGPIAGVVVGMIDDQFIINPTVEQMAKSQMHLTVAGSKDAIMMVEGGANEIPEKTMSDAIFFAHDEIRRIVEFQETIYADAAPVKMEVQVEPANEELEQAVLDFAWDKLENAVKNPDKLERESHIDEVKELTLQHFAENYPDEQKTIAKKLEKMLKEIVRKMMLEEGERVDGRKLNEIRKVTCEVGYLPRPHGSGLFTRGQTQVLSVTTLGAISEEQRLDGLGVEESKRYIHHYNFPPYSTGETKPMRGPGRRK